MEILEKPDHKIGTKIRGLATVLGAVAAMSLLSGDTGQSALPYDCDGTTIVVGDVLGAGDGRTWPACVAIDGIGDLRYP